MQKITPCLWFDTQAEEAVNFYTSLFPDSKIGRTLRYDEASAKVSGRPEGSVLTIDFQLAGQDFVALNGGPIFKITPATSFSVACKDEADAKALWQKLSDGGKVLMELQSYPWGFYGWVQDKFGLSWQVGVYEAVQKIMPSLLFVNKMNGKAEEAIKFYTSLFENSAIESVVRYEKGEPGIEGSIKYSLSSLGGQKFVAMDGPGEHAFTFTEGMSYMISCKTQEEVDKFWNALTADGGQESQCGWLKDKWGVSWQVVPERLNELIADKDPARAKRAMEAMLTMQKIIIADIEKAVEGK